MTSKPEFKNSDSAVSKVSSKKSTDLKLESWELPDGRTFTAKEMAQLKWETRIELLLYKILKKSS